MNKISKKQIKFKNHQTKKSLKKEGYHLSKNPKNLQNKNKNQIKLYKTNHNKKIQKMKQMIKFSLERELINKEKRMKVLRLIVLF